MCVFQQIFEVLVVDRFLERLESSAARADLGGGSLVQLVPGPCVREAEEQANVLREAVFVVMRWRYFGAGRALPWRSPRRRKKTGQGASYSSADWPWTSTTTKNKATSIEIVIHGSAHRGANGVAMPTDKDDQDGHFFYNHPERGAYFAA